LVVAFNKEEEEHLDMLYARGLTNKVPKEFLSIISQKEVREREPNISKDVTKALVCTSS
jgi:glycerol-3-phosphate dehydrogenase